MFDKSYHRELKYLHVGCEKPHAYFIPFHSADAARTGDRAISEFFVSLCGEWDFKYYRSVSDIDDIDGVEFSERLSVPFNWQMALDRDYDKPHYTNHNYPFPVDPPHLPDDIPCGLYRRTFEVSEKTLREKSVRLIFEGVDSCFYLYINGKFVGYSQVSHSTSEFIINQYLCDGVNEVRVLVLKWCHGSYLEDQDKYRLSGIFREVYLLYRDPVCITDMYIKTKVADDFKSAVITAEFETVDKMDIVYSLYSPTGERIAEGVSDGTGISLDIPAPMLWSDETPHLYELYINMGCEHIRQRIGIRRFEIKGKVIYINGKKVKGKGVNRHDSHPELGYAVPLDHMIRDLHILKANNINMIRTSHYPPDPRFLGLCDALGFYVCDETDLETHGMNDYGDWSKLTDSTEWSAAYLDRVQRMFEQDKNHPCVLMWSLGNESGDGINHKLMADYLHERMPNAIVHSDGVTRTRFFKYMEAKRAADRRLVDCEFVDVETRMYLSPNECIRYYLRNRNIKKPFMLCEYAHSMGNSQGDLESYWQTIYKYDNFFGACVWEMADHSVNIGTREKPMYTYGGDFGDTPNDFNFCVDGLLYPDRRPHTAMLEYKQVLRPVRLIDFNIAEKTVTLRNYRYFTDLSDMDMLWSIERNGKVIDGGRIKSLRVRPQQRRTYYLPFDDEAEFDGLCYLNLSFVLNRPRQWADEGYEICFEQLELNFARLAPKIETSGGLVFKQDSASITVADGDTEYVIDRIGGLLTSVVKSGKPMISKAIEPTIWRAPTDNDRYVRVNWEKNGYDRMTVKCYSCEVIENSEKHISVETRLSLGAVAKRTLMHITLRYDFRLGEGVTLNSGVTVLEDAYFLPRFGFRFHMPKDFESMKYFGRGPFESYIDKRHASKMGLYASTVSEHFEHYIKPQENMAHADTAYLAISNENGEGLLLTGADKSPAFSFNCSHFTTEQLTNTMHDYELIPLEDTVVHIDYRHSGIGSNSCGPRLDDSLRLLDKQFEFSFRILPCMTEGGRRIE
ncbi:MAG: DUF4981 domain-containing protein [Clostridia bacterium]|nr:DUF4981 domain-containing protein [Clostridia bacterium]